MSTSPALFCPRLLSLLILLCTCPGCLGPIRSIYPASSADTHDIYIASNGWHTSLVLPAGELSPRAQSYLKTFDDFHWIEIGWGDDEFYRAPKGTAWLAIKAMFASHGSVLHVVGVTSDPSIFYKRYAVTLYRLRVSAAGFHLMESRILDSFETDDRNQSVELQPGLYGFSRFYKAKGNYCLLHTCNNWTAETIRQTGFPITPFWATNAGNIEFQLMDGKYRAEKVRGPNDP